MKTATSFPGSLFFPPGRRKKRNPGNEVVKTDDSLNKQRQFSFEQG